MATGFRGSFLWIALVAAVAGEAAGQTIGHVDQVSGTSVLLIGVSPVNQRVVWASGIRGTWLRTTDGGATWQGGKVPGADSLQFRDVQGVDEQNAYLLSIGEGNLSRIYKTNDGGATWSLQFTNQEPKAFYDCMDFWDASRGIVIGDAVGGEIAILTTWRWRRHLEPESLQTDCPKPRRAKEVLRRAEPASRPSRVATPGL